MRYLIILLVFLPAVLQAQGKEYRPYLDVFANAGMLFSTSESLTDAYGVAYKERTNAPAKFEAGSEILFRRKPTQVCMSLGIRLGYIGLHSVSDTAHTVHDGSGGHGAFSFGINYVSHTNEPKAFRAGMLIGCGMRADGTSLHGINAHFIAEATATKYFNKHVGAGMNITWYPIMSTLLGYDSSTNQTHAATFSMWSVSARLSWTFLRNEERSRRLAKR